MTFEGWRRAGAMVLVAAGFGSLAFAGPIGSEPRALQPTSRTAEAITGPIILSAERIVFSSGVVADLTQVNDAVPGPWNPYDETDEATPAQVFRLKSDPGELLNGNKLCGEPASFVAVSQSRFFGTWSLGLFVFSGPEEPSSVNSPGLCATFTYALDGQLADVAPATLDAPANALGAGELQPLDEEDASATGPIRFSQTGFQFGSGSLSINWAGSIPPYYSGALSSTHPVFLFSVSADPGPLLDGSSICPDGSPHFVSATVRSDAYEGPTLQLDFFTEDPRGRENPEAGYCSNYRYLVPEGVDLFAGLPQPVTPEELGFGRVPDTGFWNVSRSTNPVDDSPTVVLSLTADSGASSFGQPVEFIARCQSNTTEVYAVWHTYVGDDSSDVYDEWKYVTVRIGDQPATEERWSVSTGRDATFAPSWAGDLLKQMLTSNSLVLQTTPYGENPITAVFDTSGLDVALRELADTCNWTY